MEIVCLSWYAVCFSVPLSSQICLLFWPPLPDAVTHRCRQTHTLTHNHTHCLSRGSPCVWPPCRVSRWVAQVCVTMSMCVWVCMSVCMSVCVCVCVWVCRVNAWPVLLPTAILFPSHYFMLVHIAKTLVPSFLLSPPRPSSSAIFQAHSSPRNIFQIPKIVLHLSVFLHCFHDSSDLSSSVVSPAVPSLPSSPCIFSSSTAPSLPFPPPLSHFLFFSPHFPSVWIG